MTDILSTDQVRELKRIAAAPQRKSMIELFLMKQVIQNLRMSHDPFGIYASRKALAQVMPCEIYRGHEWWTDAADNAIRRDLDA